MVGRPTGRSSLERSTPLVWGSDVLPRICSRKSRARPNLVAEFLAGGGRVISERLDVPYGIHYSPSLGCQPAIQIRFNLRTRNIICKSVIVTANCFLQFQVAAKIVNLEPARGLQRLHSNHPSVRMPVCIVGQQLGDQARAPDALAA
jgi:hypothetical protein